VGRTASPTIGEYPPFLLEFLRGDGPRPSCHGTDPEQWFLPSGAGAAPLIAKAKAVCALCPLRPRCRDWALDQGYTLYGVWGGLTRQERLAILGKRGW